jgi:hypothetical protein
MLHKQVVMRILERILFNLEKACGKATYICRYVEYLLAIIKTMVVSEGEYIWQKFYPISKRSRE